MAFFDIQEFLSTDNMLPKNHHYGVECVLKDADETVFNIVTLSERKKKVEIKQSFEEKNNEELKKIIKKDSAINLIINGKGVITKKISFAPADEDSVLINKCLPGANATDFYFQKYMVSETVAYISVIRKQSLDALLNFFASNKILVVSVSLGPFSIENIFSLLNLNQYIEQQIHVGFFELSILSGKIDQIKHIEANPNSSLPIGDIQIKSSLLFAFIAAMGFYIPSEIKIQDTKFALNKEEHKELKLHNTMMQWFMAALVIICFSSFGFYKYYRSEFKTYYAKVQINQEKLARYENLKEEITEKKDLLSKNGLLQSSKISYYSDEIAASLQQDIKLTRMEFSPIKKVSKDGKDELFFQGEKLLVAGHCSESFDFNEWVKTLQKLKWVKTVSILNYMQDRSSELASFNIELQLNQQ
ncbi:MAG TPA: hypothetical protein VKG26_00570 [Bacteroidia bacterium]|nr:hypothetical protein [Bacteroidia bacterium]